MALNYDKDTVKQKIDCCFAATVYEKYLNKRYGINYCNLPTKDKLEELRLLKSTYDYFYKTDFNCFLEADSLTSDTENSCNIELIIEKINLI